MWVVFCSTDFLDGYLARRQGTTSAGAFLDPLADKVLILGAMFTLVSTGVFWVVPVVIITAREVIISVYRVLVGGKGISVPASKLAKYKTVCQQLAVALRPAAADSCRRHLALEFVPLDRGGAGPREWCPVPVAGPSARGGGVRVDRRGTRRDRSNGDSRMTLRCDVLAVGTELLLGQIIDSNSAWIGGRTGRQRHRLARAGQGRRQRRADRNAAASTPRQRRCSDHVRRARADPRRSDP